MTTAILPPLPVIVPASLEADVPPARIEDRGDRLAVEAVRADPTVVRPLEVKRVGTSLAAFEALLADLPGTARLVERIGAGRYHIEALPGGRLRIEDGHGARAIVDTLVSRPGERIYRAVGGLSLPAIPEIRGTGVVSLRYEEEGSPGVALEGDRDATGGARGGPVRAHAEGPAVWTGGQIHFRLESAWLHTLARPIVRVLQRVVDAKVRELVDAAIAVCEHEVGGRQPTSPTR